MEDFAHQTTDFERARNKRYFGLLWEQGCGKTRTAIALAENHFKEGRISACMVITTKGLVRNWSDEELPIHSSIPYAFDVWPNRRVTETDQMYYWMVNIDALLTDGYTKRMSDFITIYPKFMCIIDESTVIKTPGAKRTRRAWKVGELATARLIMTGVPSPHGPFDLYAQCKFLSPAALGFADFRQFKYQYAQIELVSLGPGRSYPKIIKYKNLDDLKERLSKFTSIRKLTECVDMPPIRQRVFPVPLTEEQWTYYNELQEEWETEINGELVDVSNTLVLINKCMQLCSGQMKLADGRYVDVPNDRIDALQELVDECPGQTIVWTAFVHNATAIGTHFGKDALLLPSGLSLDQRQLILGRFKAGEGKLLVANPASAGHGLTLTNCSNAIHYSRSFNFEHRAQADARIYRISQTQPCLITDLCDPETIEAKVIRTLMMRKQMSDFILDGKFLKNMLERNDETDRKKEAEETRDYLAEAEPEEVTGPPQEVLVEGSEEADGPRTEEAHP